MFYTSSASQRKKGLLSGQMAHQSEGRYQEALSQDLGTISSNVLGISLAGGNSIWASLTGMSSGLSRCRNIEGGYWGFYLQDLHKISSLGQECTHCCVKVDKTGSSKEFFIRRFKKRPTKTPKFLTYASVGLFPSCPR